MSKLCASMYRVSIIVFVVVPALNSDVSTKKQEIKLFWRKATPNQLLVSHSPPHFLPASTFQPYQFVLTIWRMRRLPLR